MPPFQVRTPSPTLPRWLLLSFFLLYGSSPIASAATRPIDEDWVVRWRSDLAYAADSLPRAHPNFYHSVSREAYRAALDSLSARLPLLAQHEIVVELARIVALVGDGHTRLTFPFDPVAGFFTGHMKTATPKIPNLVFRHYPIRFELFADTLWVTRTDSTCAALSGGRVVRLGRLSADSAMAAVEPTVQRDNDRQVASLLPIWLVCPEILHARGVTNDMERLELVVERADGARVTSSLSPVIPGHQVEWLEARDRAHLPLRDLHPEEAHWFVAIPGTRAVYARYREVRDEDGETVAAFADSLLAFFDATGAERLIFDVRGNVGGDGSLNRPILLHLIRNQRLRRPGALWGLIDRGTFSAAVMFAADLESWTPAILVGEKTGGHPNSYGDSKRIVLPESGITIRVSSLFWQLTSPQDARDGVTPHCSVEMRFDDWSRNVDPVLAAALASAPSGADFSGEWRGVVGWRFDREALGFVLERNGDTWSGTVDLSWAELEGAPLERVDVRGNEVTVSWSDGAGLLTFEGELAGPRVVGVLRSGGVDLPVVLERVREAGGEPQGVR